MGELYLAAQSEAVSFHGESVNEALFELRGGCGPAGRHPVSSMGCLGASFSTDHCPLHLASVNELSQMGIWSIRVENR